MACICHFVQLENFLGTLLPELRKLLQVISVWMILHNFIRINMRSFDVVDKPRLKASGKVRSLIAHQVSISVRFSFVSMCDKKVRNLLPTIRGKYTTRSTVQEPRSKNDIRQPEIIGSISRAYSFPS